MFEDALADLVPIVLRILDWFLLTSRRADNTAMHRAKIAKRFGGPLLTLEVPENLIARCGDAWDWGGISERRP